MHAQNTNNARLRSAILCALAAVATQAPAAEMTVSEYDAGTKRRSQDVQHRCSEAFRALIQLTEQAGLQLIYPRRRQGGRPASQALVGQYTTEAALDSLLKGVGAAIRIPRFALITCRFFMAITKR